MLRAFCAKGHVFLSAFGKYENYDASLADKEKISRERCRAVPPPTKIAAFPAAPHAETDTAAALLFGRGRAHADADSGVRFQPLMLRVLYYIAAYTRRMYRCHVATTYHQPCSA